eukprot:COSAG01_NODE_655_length_14476_cov_6.592265_7_plen_106_part_00
MHASIDCAAISFIPSGFLPAPRSPVLLFNTAPAAVSEPRPSEGRPPSAGGGLACWQAAKMTSCKMAVIGHRALGTHARRRRLTCKPTPAFFAAGWLTASCTEPSL